MGEPLSQKQQREWLVRSLRAEGKSRVEVAEALRQRYRQLKQARADMCPWEHTAAVRALDDRLASYGLV